MKRWLVPTLLLVLSTGALAGGWDKIAGGQSEIRQPLTAAVRTQAEWEALWKRHNGGSKPAPEVDFSKEIVVAVFIGERRTGGVKVELETMTDPQDASKLVVLYREIAPKNDSIAADVISYPFAIRKIATTCQSVEFALNRQVRALERAAISAKAASYMGGVIDHAWAFAQAPRFD